METFHQQNNIDAEIFKNEVINVFFETELDNSSETENSPNKLFLAPHG